MEVSGSCDISLAQDFSCVGSLSLNIDSKQATAFTGGILSSIFSI